MASHRHYRVNPLSPSHALRRLQYFIPDRSYASSTETYVKRFCQLNGYVPSRYLIQGKEITL